MSDDLVEQPDTPYTRYQRAQRTADGMERQRDTALIAFIEAPSVENQQNLQEAMAGARQARRELNGAMMSVMYFLATQEISSDEELGTIGQILRTHSQQIANLEANVKEQAA